MSWDVIMQLISTGCFPIVACIAMAFFFNKVNDNYRSDIKELTTSHKVEMDAMTKAITDNTLVIQKLVDYMEKGDDCK